MSGPWPSWLTVREHGVELRVRVAPRSSEDRVDGHYGDRVRIRVTAPPVGDAANLAVARLTARAARVAPSRVRIVVGHRSRSKTLFVDEPEDPEGLAARIFEQFESRGS